MSDQSERSLTEVQEAEQILAALRTILVQRFRIPERNITHAASFRGTFGFDSLDTVDFVAELETTFGIERAIDDLTNIHTVANVIDLVMSARAARAKAPATMIDSYRRAAEVHERGITILDDSGTGTTFKSYADLFVAARRLATALSGSISRGERVLLLFPTSFDFLESFVAVQLLGAIPIPCYPPPDLQRLGIAIDRLSGIARRTESSVCLTNPLLKMLFGTSLPLRELISVDKLASADAELQPWPEPRASDTALIQCSSGSTGHPRGVVLSHKALVAHITTLEQYSGVRSDRDVLVTWLPLYHDMGLIGFLLSGVCWTLSQVLMSPMTFLRRPITWLECIHKYRATIIGSPPLGYAICNQRAKPEESGLDLSSVRIASCGADWINLGILETFAKKFERYGFRGETFAGCYGLAENTLAVTMVTPPRALRFEYLDARALECGEVIRLKVSDSGAKAVVSAGTPLRGCEVTIVNDAGEPLAEGHVGEIVVAGASLMDGYYNDPETTLSRFDGTSLKTGDLGFFLDGELFVTGRTKDLIKIRGRNLYALDLEEAAESIPAVRTSGAVAFSVYNEEAGAEEAVIVCESTAPAAEYAALADAVRAVISERFEVRLKDVAIVARSVVPKTPSGKKQRGLCRQQYVAGQLPPLVVRGDEESPRKLP